MTKGQRIRERREQMHFGLTELAERVNITKQTLYKYENDIVTNIPSDKIEELAKVLNTTPAYIMGWEETIEDKIASLPLNEKEMQEAMRFYSYYKKLNPNDQTAIRTLLESLRSDS